MPMQDEDRVIELLEQILRVTALQVASDKSMTERARLLKTAGLDNLTIAKVLNTSSAVIRTLTSNLNRAQATTSRRPKVRVRRRVRRRG
jgi:hypothetical protein